MCIRNRQLLLAAIITSATANAQPLSSAITYQGQLRQAGTPPNGSFEMQFSLWDAAGSGSPPTGGTQVGATLTFDGRGSHPPPVAVTNGLFTVQLDFGSGLFDGNARWLQVVIEGETLAPRQLMTATPYALYAANAPHPHSLDAVDGSPVDALFVDGSGRVGVGTTTPGEALHLVRSTNCIARFDSGNASNMYYSALDLADRGTAIWGVGKDALNNF